MASIPIIPSAYPRAHVKDLVRDIRRDDFFRGFQVERLDVGNRAVGFLISEEGLGAEHYGGGRIDSPRDPAGGRGRASEEDDGERGCFEAGVVVGVLEGGVLGGEVDAVGEGFVGAGDGL